MELNTQPPQENFFQDEIDLRTGDNAWKAQHSFEMYRKTIRPGILWNPFVARITRELERFGEAFEDGKRPKLAISTPPQHGKSTAAEDLASWMAGRNPDFKAIYASYSENLGTRMNLNLQRVISSRRYRDVFPNLRIGLGSWVMNTGLIEYVRHEGSFRSTTINGPITGLELNLGILDDFAKGRAEANSKVARDKTWNWLSDDFMTRFSKDSAFLTICTRWHIDDVLGRLKKKWPEMNILTFPALAERDEKWRKKGEALFPEHKPISQLLDQKRIMSEASWAAEYQGHPFLSGSGAIPIEKLRVVPFFDRKNISATVLSVDKAGTEGGDGASAQDDRRKFPLSRWHAKSRQEICTFMLDDGLMTLLKNAVTSTGTERSGGCGGPSFVSFDWRYAKQYVENLVGFG